MTYPDPITLDLDPSGYITGLGQAEERTEAFAGTLRTAAMAVSPMQQAMDQITPKRAALASWVGFTAVAGKAEQQLSTLRATAKTTGANFETLTKGTRALARELPISNAASRELVTTITKLGVATKGSEQTVVNLAKTFTRMSGATGEGPAGLAAGMIQLSRATNLGFNTTRIDKLGDALTTVSAQSGASATGILDFSKAIAPMANASGIGTTKILGISAAFSKLGEDGFGAANAFNKMLGDLNRSVREGSPEMAKYAQIVGKSRAEFEALFKSDPTEAIVRVTEAIATAGTSGPRILETLGLEGVRTQRQIQQVSVSGGLRTAVAQASAGFGSGASADAAASAFGGLADSTQRLASVMGQTAEAIGGPFLATLEKITDVTGAGVGGVRAVVASSPVQRIMEVGAPIVLGALALFKGLPMLAQGLTAFQLATSGPIRGLLGGYAASGAPGAGIAGRLGGNAYNQLVAAGMPVGRGRFAAINEDAAVRGAGLGRLVQGSVAGTGPSMLRMVAGAGVGGAALYLRALGESSRLSRLPFDERQARMGIAGQAFDQRRETVAGVRSAVAAGTMSAADARGVIRQVNREFLGHIGQANVGLRTLGRGIAVFTGQTLASTAALGGRGLMAAGRGVMGLAGGPLGLALMAGMGGFALKSAADAETRRREDAAQNMTSFLDDYRVALGKATEATSTFAGSMETASRANRNQLDRNSALQLTGEDIAASRRQGAKRVMSYSGSADQVARRINNSLAGSEVAPDEIQQIQQDLLLSGYDPETVRRITGQIKTGGTDLTSSATGSIAAEARDVAGMKGRSWWRSGLDWVEDNVAGGKSSTRFTIDNLSGTQQERGREMVAGIGRRQSERMIYGTDYATSESFKELDAAIEAAFKAGNEDLAEHLMLTFQGQGTSMVSDGLRGKKFSWDQLERYGGSYTAALAGADAQGFGRGLYNPTMNAVRSGMAAPQLQAGWVSENLAGNPLASLFSATGTGNANALVRSLMANPESPLLQTQALQATLQEQGETGTSMVELSRAATEAANKLGQLDDATIAFLDALRQAARFQISAGAPFRSSGQTLRLRAEMAADDASIAPNTNEARQRQREGVLELAAVRDEAVNTAKAIVTARREAQVQMGRMEEDYQRQVEWSNADYQRSLLRAEEDYGTQRVRAHRDRNRQVQRAEENFAKQMRRAAEDSARAMYDPYQRIQVQAVWDAPNLMGNLTEQADAMATQLSNLGRLRGAGVSNAVVQMLGLNDPKNAQQLGELVASIANDPAFVGRLNEVASRRVELGVQLANDAGNVQMTRAREDFRLSMTHSTQDFATAMADMAAEHAKGLRRAEQDRATAMDRMATQNRTVLERMREDINRADQEIVTDLAGYHDMLTKLINGQTVDFKDKTRSTLSDTLDLLKDFGAGWNQIVTDFGTSLTITVEKNGSAAHFRQGEMNSQGRGGGEGMGWQRQWAAVSDAFPSAQLHSSVRPGARTSSGAMSYHASGRAIDITPNMQIFNWLAANYPNSKELIYTPAGNRQLRNGEPYKYGGKVAEDHWDHIHWAMAKGGIAVEPTRALLAEAGSAESIIPLNEAGMSFLVGAMRTFLSPEDARSLGASGGVTYVTYDHSSTVIDKSVIIEHVDLQAETPRELAALAEEEARRRNLTAAPHRRTRR